MNRAPSHKMAAIVTFTLAGVLLALIALGVTLGWGIDRVGGLFIALPLLIAQGIAHTYLLGKARR